MKSQTGGLKRRDEVLAEQKLGLIFEKLTKNSFVGGLFLLKTNLRN
jgi:hypothetical protein